MFLLSLQKVRAHDDSCPCAKLPDKNASSLLTPDLKLSSTYDTVDLNLECKDEDESVASRDVECPICMSPMNAGDIVSYNFSSSCSAHVFHHACIKEWLLRHASCPTCRQTYMPIDDPSSFAHRQKSRAFTKSRHKQLTEERVLWGSRTFVCEKSGLVVADTCRALADANVTPRIAVNGALSSTIEWIQRTCPTVKRVDLVTLRGIKAGEGKTVSVDEDDEVGPAEVPFAD
jgi:Ring finger domain